jgi:uncharacterized protein YdeI (YjbR/CyaY-like superfamily)
MRYGGVDYVGFNREVRQGAGVAAGDVVTLVVELDTEERSVIVPEDLAAAFAAVPGAAAAFDGLSFTHRKEYVRWIEEAKRDETRRGRVEKTIAMLFEGIKHP